MRRYQLVNASQKRCHAGFIDSLSDTEFRLVFTERLNSALQRRFLECLEDEPIYLTSLMHQALRHIEADDVDEVDDAEIDGLLAQMETVGEVDS